LKGVILKIIVPSNPLAVGDAVKTGIWRRGYQRHYGRGKECGFYLKGTADREQPLLGRRE